MNEQDDSPEHSDDQAQDESRLARWSRRKAEQRSAAAPVAPSVETLDSLLDVPAEGALVEAEVELESPEAQTPVLTDADMPPVHTLSSESDYSGFLSPGVSQELRKLALRKMFSLPSFQLRDGLDDYDDDFTVFEPLGDTVTSDPWTYRQQRLAAEREAAERESAAQDQAKDASGEQSAEADTQQSAEESGDDTQTEDEKIDPAPSAEKEQSEQDALKNE